MNVTTSGVDLAKQVFQVHGVDERGRTVLRKRLRRNQMMPFFAQRPPCLVGMEACGGAHHWARRLTELGYTVKLMAPQFVKPYVKTNKNDTGGTEAICEAVSRPATFAKVRLGRPLLDREKSVLYARRNTISLTWRELKILEVLTTGAGEPLSKDEILAGAWRNALNPDASALRSAIQRLRAKLKESSLSELIQTARGRGYFLNVPVPAPLPTTYSSAIATSPCYSEPSAIHLVRKRHL
jgi:transposase